jgi:glycosyltransferase involved in cell wall biosynthesis
MRFLISVSSITSGSGLSQYILSLCELLAKEHDVYVVTTHNGANTDYEATELKKISERIRLFSLGGEKKVRKYLHVIALIWKLRPNIIINNYNAVIQYCLPFISRRVKVVHILHNDTDDFYRVGAINGEKTTGWIAPTKAVADNFNTYTECKYADKVKVISHGVASTLQPVKSVGKPIEIIFTGVLYSHKGVLLLPAIIHSLQEKGIEFHFTIVGGGELKDWLSEEFKSEITAGSVDLTGVISHDEVYKKMASADIFLYPTHLDSFGLVIAEAMMNGAVPVVTNLPGVTDNLIRNHVDGYLIEKDDTEGFATIIAQLANNRDKLAAMSAATHRRAVSALSIEQMQLNYTNYFHTL